MTQFFILHPQPSGRPVRNAALKVFCLVRRAQHGVAQIPVQVKAVAHDVRDAWRESARPNV